MAQEYFCDLFQFRIVNTFKLHSCDIWQDRPVNIERKIAKKEGWSPSVHHIEKYSQILFITLSDETYNLREGKADTVELSFYDDVTYYI